MTVIGLIGVFLQIGMLALLVRKATRFGCPGYVILTFAGYLLMTARRVTSMLINNPWFDMGKIAEYDRTILPLAISAMLFLALLFYKPER